MKIQLVFALSLALGCASASALTPFPSDKSAPDNPATASVAEKIRTTCQDFNEKTADDKTKDFCQKQAPSKLKEAISRDAKNRGLSQEDVGKILKKCSVTNVGVNPTKLKNARTCMDAAVSEQANRNKISDFQQMLGSTSKVSIDGSNSGQQNNNEENPAASVTNNKTGASEDNNTGNPRGTPKPSTPTNTADSNPPTGTAASGQHVSSSVFSTPSACITDGADPANGNKQNNPDLVGVRRELLAPKEASDVYGRRLGKRYIVYQVRISDYSKDYQYIVHDISLYLGRILQQRNDVLAAKAAQEGQPPGKVADDPAADAAAKAAARIAAQADADTATNVSTDAAANAAPKVAYADAADAASTKADSKQAAAQAAANAKEEIKTDAAQDAINKAYAAANAKDKDRTQATLDAEAAAKKAAEAADEADAAVKDAAQAAAEAAAADVAKRTADDDATIAKKTARDAAADAMTKADALAEAEAEADAAAKAAAKAAATKATKDEPKLSKARYLASSRDLEVLRGVPEKGQDYDPRNLTLHILTGIGSVAGGVGPLTPFSDVMGSAVSLFSGAFIQAFTGIYPDHTGTQLNRLSDQAFTSNKVVDKLHTSVFTIFIPQSMLLDEAEQKTFWSHPRELLDKYSLDRVNVCVDGSLVTEVSVTPNPAFSPTSTNVGPGTTVTISDGASDAVIYYTDVDGTTPTSSSTKYPGSITLPDLKTPNTTMNIQAIAISPGKQQSSIVSQTYVISRMPTASVSADGSTVTLTGAVVGETIYYTINGDAPTSTVSNTNIPCKPSSATTKATCSNISVTGTTSFTVKAVEYDTAAPPSPGPVGTFSYTPPKTAATAK